MKKLVEKIDLDEYPADLDNYIGKKVNNKKIDGWEAEWDSRDGLVYWHSDRKGSPEDDWIIIASAGYDYPPINFLFDVLDGSHDPVVKKKIPYKPSNLEKDFKLYVKYLKQVIKLAEKKMK